MRASVAITAIDQIPPTRQRKIICRLCGQEFDRWERRSDPESPRRSGVWALIAHQIEAHKDGQA